MPSVPAIRVPIVGDDRTGRAIMSAERGIRGLGRTAATVFGALGVGLGVSALVRFGAALEETSRKFDTAAREVNTLLNLSDEGFSELSDQIQRLSKDIGIDLVNTTKSAYQAISAGIPKEDLLGFLEVSATAGIAGLVSTEKAVDGLTTAVNAFGKDSLKANRAADIMFSTVKEGKTTFGELSDSLFIASPLASQVGVSFAEMTAAAAALTKQGAPTSVAMTQIRSALVAMKKPTDDMQAALNQLGVTNADVLIKNEGFVGALSKLRNSAQENGIELIKLFGRVEGLSGVLGLTGQNAEEFNRILTENLESAGDALEAFAISNESAQRKSEQLKASWENLLVTIADTSQFNASKDAIGGWFDYISSRIDGTINEIETLPQVLGAIERAKTDILNLGLLNPFGKGMRTALADLEMLQKKAQELSLDYMVIPPAAQAAADAIKETGTAAAEATPEINRMGEALDATKFSGIIKRIEILQRRFDDMGRTVPENISKIKKDIAKLNMERLEGLATKDPQQIFSAQERLLQKKIALGRLEERQAATLLREEEKRTREIQKRLGISGAAIRDKAPGAEFRKPSILGQSQRDFQRLESERDARLRESGAISDLTGAARLDRLTEDGPGDKKEEALEATKSATTQAAELMQQFIQIFEGFKTKLELLESQVENIR